MSNDQIFAFVLMPFSSKFNDVYRLGIKEPAEALGLRVERVDEQIFDGGILDRICRQIDAADIIIADMSDQNPNVFYEVGYAHAKGKLCVLLTNNADDIPFDLRHRRHIVYEGSIDSLRKHLASDLIWAKDQIDAVRKSRIRVAVKNISGFLDRNDLSAIAKVWFQIDLHNDSDIASAEIETIYFYTSEHWTVYQAKETCAVTDSDLPKYKRRHFLSSPIKRLQKSGWAQLAFRSDRLMASTWLGQEIKGSYAIRGISNLRLVTDKGSFDYPILIDTSVDEIAF